MQQRADANAPYRKLASILRAQGWLKKPPPIRTVLELALHIALLLGSMAGFVLAGSLVVELLMLLTMTIGSLGIVTSAHSSSHNATTKRPSVDRSLVFLCFPFFHGLSATYWRDKHVIVHHPNPNVLDVDNDIKLAPNFAINTRDFQTSKGTRRVYYKYVQGFVIPFAMALITLNTVKNGWSYLLSALADAERRRPLHWVDLGVIALHWGVWLCLPMLFFNPVDVIGLYIIRMALLGYGSFIMFAPAHFPAEAAFAHQSEKDEKDFMLRQTTTTVNFTTGPLSRIFCSGAGYQIEHHLFPGIPHTYYPAVSSIIKRFCEENGYPYQTLGWSEGVLKSVKVFFRPKPVLDDLASMRAQPGAGHAA